MGLTKIIIGNVFTELEDFPQHLLKELSEQTSYCKDPSIRFRETESGWDGFYRFLRIPKIKNPYLPTGLRNAVIDLLKLNELPFEIVDTRIRPDSPPSEYDEIPLFPYQEEAVEFLTAFPDVILNASPRSGKTRCLFETVRRLNLPTLWLAPTNQIVDQTVLAGRQFFRESDCVRTSSAFQGEHREALLTVCTSTGALHLPEDFWKSRQCLVIDEFHHCTQDGAVGKCITERTGHIYHRKGATGTLFRSGEDSVALLATISNVGFTIDSKRLLELGRLVPCHSIFIPVETPLQRCDNKRWNGPTGFGTVGITECDYRNNLAAYAAKHLSDSGYSVIILVNTKKQGYYIRDLIKEMFPPTSTQHEFEHVEFVSTDRMKYSVRKVLDSFVGGQEVKILIGTSIIGEGTDLPPADALVFASGGKAAVSYYQALYRVATADHGKDHAVVVDFADQHHKKLLEHSRKRWYFQANDPVFQCELLPTVGDFHGWVAGLGSKEL
jgi:superfamily II DNA or RNA helicase